jgi:peptidoglycan hydrolase-like protein with peptidoglycan-binding domain
MRRRVTVATMAVVAVGVAAALLLRGGSGDSAAASVEESGTTTVAAERRTLVARDSVSGTLGYADERAVINRLHGTYTRVPAEGSTLRRGDVLFDLDGEPGAVLMDGALPMWRDLQVGVSDGQDIVQLERNLRALGYDSDKEMTVDDHFSAATSAAVKRWQEDLGLDETGIVELGRVVFLPTPRRVGNVSAQVGSEAGPGPALVTTGTRRTVTIELDTAKQEEAAVGADVQVELPNGRIVTGAVTEVGRVARQTEEGTVIDVIVTLARGARVPALDAAPVTVELVRERRKDALVVPVTALLARAGGGYAVEVDRGGRRELVHVELGLYTDAYVEILDGGLRVGDRVVVPQ